MHNPTKEAWPPDRLPLKILLAPVGTLGDMHPFLALAKRLRRRGHGVTVIANDYFRTLAERLSLDFVPVGTKDEYYQWLRDPRLWHPLKFLEALADGYIHNTSALFEVIRDLHVPGRTVVAASGLAFGARLAQEALGVPLATIHLQPYCLRSVHEAPVLLPALSATNTLPRTVKRLIFLLADIRADRILAAPINQIRNELGLPPVHRIFAEWWCSPDRVIGLFPPWFGPPQPDWPEQTRLTGFLRYDEGADTPVSSEVEEFLREGQPPIVFTLGSGMVQGKKFFENSAAACRSLGRRGVLLTRHSEQLPYPLPDGVRHFDYVPFSRLLPRSAGLVHHGGIGTLAQGLAAGVPQLVCPMAWDQFDNAVRLRQSGVAAEIKPTDYRAPAVARALERLLNSRQISMSCQNIAEMTRSTTQLDQTCQLVESLANRIECPPGESEPPRA